MSIVNQFVSLFAQAAGHDAPPGIADLPLGPKLGIAFGVVILGLLLWGLKNPQLWVIVSVLSLGLGVGAAIYGITLHNSLAEPKAAPMVEHASLVIGCGVGGAVGGFVLLIVAVMRMRTNSERKP